MGQAKARGTFEERKQQAIEAGRIKKPAQPKSRVSETTGRMLAMQAVIVNALMRKDSKKKMRKK